jgi:hypothetical protein
MNWNDCRVNRPEVIDHKSFNGVQSATAAVYFLEEWIYFRRNVKDWEESGRGRF